MSARRVVIATTSFTSQKVEELAGKHPAVTGSGAIHQGTRLWSDDPIVLATPHLFVDESIVPGPPGVAAPPAARLDERLNSPKGRALVVAHRKTGQARPKLRTVAVNMGWESEQPLRDLIHGLGFKDWYDVHDAVAAETE